MLIFKEESFLARSQKLQKAIISIVMSVRIQNLDTHWMDSRVI